MRRTHIPELAQRSQLVDLALALFGPAHGIDLILPTRTRVPPKPIEFEGRAGPRTRHQRRYEVAIDLQALRRYIDQGERDKSRTARFHATVLKHPELFERMDGEERKRAAALLFGRESYATEINKMLALSRQLAAEGCSLRTRE